MMKTVINKTLLFFLLIGILSCEKERFTTAPQIKFISLTPNSWSSDNTSTFGPRLKFQLTDREGDFGWNSNDSSFVYIRVTKDTLKPYVTFLFPILQIAQRQNLDAEVEVDLVFPNSVLPPRNNPSPRIDTLYFEFFVKDLAKNKSNTVITPTPFFYYIQ